MSLPASSRYMLTTLLCTGYYLEADRHQFKPGHWKRQHPSIKPGAVVRYWDEPNERPQHANGQL